jgi:diguanylate cyclase (GGDEF)-like protein
MADSVPTDSRRLLDFLTDDETSLLRPSYFELRFEEEFKKAWRYGWSCSLLLVAVDGLDELAAKEGRLAVESARLDICGQILSATRDTDLSARLGDSLFAILLPGTGESGTRAFVERVIRAMGEGAFGRYRVSVGGCVTPDTAVKTADDFLAAARRAVDEAREAGDGRFVIAEPTPS